jgi:EAL domain-containing protein (putative c-di-GMP-specific phosphodiesterase class I)
MPKHDPANDPGPTLACAQHYSSTSFPVPYSMAFQPIIDIDTKTIYAYEALVRGVNGEPANTILDLADDSNRYDLDQGCRMKAIEMASDLGMANTGASLSINFYPNAVYNAASCIRRTLETATRKNFPLDRLIFEVTEGERVRDQAHLNSIIREYRARGFRVAIDDFGAGYAGLNLLANFQPDILKIDRELTREVDSRLAPRVIIQAIMTACHALGVQVIAEGVETRDELLALRDLGVRYFQGFFFAHPGFEHLPWWIN